MLELAEGDIDRLLDVQDALQQQPDLAAQLRQAAALRSGQVASSAAPPSANKAYIYGLLGAACVGYWALGRAEKRAAAREAGVSLTPPKRSSAPMRSWRPPSKEKLLEELTMRNAMAAMAGRKIPVAARVARRMSGRPSAAA